MKNITEYIKESIYSATSTPYTNDTLNIVVVKDDLEIMKNQWEDIAKGSQLNYLDRTSFSLSDDVDKRNFIEWLNNNVLDFKWKLKEVDPMTYNLFYTTSESNKDIYTSKYVKEIMDKINNNVVNNVCINKPIPTYESLLNRKESLKLQDYYGEEWKPLIKTIKEFEKMVETIIKEAQKSEWLNSPDYEFNYKYTMLADVITEHLEKYKVTEKTDENYFSHFEDLLEFVTEYLKIIE